jgi:hypothetical protein
MRSSLFVLLLLLAQNLFAQTDIVAQATALIVAKDYRAANIYLDSILKKQKEM